MVAPGSLRVVLIPNSCQLQADYAHKDLGEFNYFVEVRSFTLYNGLHLSQTKCNGDILKKAHMLDSKSYNTPISTTEKQTKNKDQSLKIHLCTKA